MGTPTKNFINESSINTTLHRSVDITRDIIVRNFFLFLLLISSVHCDPLTCSVVCLIKKKKKMTTPSIRPLSTELKLKAMSDLNETTDRIQSDLIVLKDWLNKCGYINSRLDDQFLIGFLRGSKFSIERTKEKLDMYYSSRFVAPEIYPKNKMSNPKIIDVLRQGISIPLPDLEHPTAPRVVIIRAGHYNPDTTHITDVFQMAVLMYAIMLLEDDNFVVSGLVSLL